jgi:hypothetical protein
MAVKRNPMKVDIVYFLNSSVVAYTEVFYDTLYIIMCILVQGPPLWSSG